MANGPPPSIGRRPLPGTNRRFSEIALSLDPPMVAPPAADDRSIALLQRARRHGVTVFDVADGRFPARAERLLARAFPEPDPELEVVVGRSPESLAREASSEGEGGQRIDFASAFQNSLERSRRRLAPLRVSVVEWTGAPTGIAGTAPGAFAPNFATPPGKEEAWSVRLIPSGTGLPTSNAGSPPLFSGGLSLLEPEAVRWFGPPNGPPGAAFIARNPFADGRLDGSLFAASTVAGAPAGAPIDVRRLRQEFGSVLRLGFLTEGRRRTLAQAALQFALYWPWVVTVVVPLPTPERIDEVLAYGSRPPLSEIELARLGFVK